MNLLLIRHGPAGEASEWARTGRSDEERPLTAKGSEMMRLAAPALRAMVKRLDVLASSPLTRAYQTAEIVTTAYDSMPLTMVAALASGGDSAALLDWLRDRKSGETIALVGHNPDLEDFAGWMLTDRRDGFIRLKKGGTALISFDDSPVPGRGALRWLLTPEQMMGMA